MQKFLTRHSTTSHCLRHEGGQRADWEDHDEVDLHWSFGSCDHWSMVILPISEWFKVPREKGSSTASDFVGIHVLPRAAPAARLHSVPACDWNMVQLGWDVMRHNSLTTNSYNDTIVGELIHNQQSNKQWWTRKWLKSCGTGLACIPSPAAPAAVRARQRHLEVPVLRLQAPDPGLVLHDHRLNSQIW